MTPKLITPDDVKVEIRGAGNAARQINHIIEPSFAADPLDLEVPRIVAAQASRLVPALAEAPVLSTWSGVRPVSPDERPLLGWVREGLFVATGHGSEGVILGAGSAEQVAALVLGAEPPFETAAFDPLRS